MGGLRLSKGKWPWRNLQPAPEEMRRAGGRCELWARKIQTAIGGTILAIEPVPFGAHNIGPVNNVHGSLVSAEFRHHYAVLVGDRVFDRITGPDGMTIDEYRKLFEWAEDLSFRDIGSL